MYIPLPSAALAVHLKSLKEGEEVWMARAVQSRDFSILNTSERSQESKACSCRKRFGNLMVASVRKAEG